MLSFITAASITLWRYCYFGDAFPQPVIAKSSGITLASLNNGFLYVEEAISKPWTAVSSLIGIFACAHILWRAWQNRVSATLSVISIAIISYSALIILMGGDWMPAGRLWVSIIPLTAITISYSLSVLLPARLFNLIMAFIILLNLTGLFALTHNPTLAINNFPTDKQIETTTSYSFFEKHSPDNYANIPTLDFLHILVSKLLALQSGGLNILSGQMGMIPYHLSLQYPGKLHFTDRNALIERSLTTCELTSNRPRAQQGIDGLNTGFFLKQSEELQKKCHIQPPDIIFDLWWHNLIPETTQMLARRGYTVVFIQQGHMSPLQDQLVAIRTTLWEAIGKPETVFISVKYSPIAH